jgi:phosphatidylglycerophosphate synthase
MSNIIKKLSFSLPWDQRIAEILSKPFIFLNIHPNIVTIVGVVLGLTAAFFYSTGNIFYAKIGSIIFFFAACFDHVDGEVARKLNKTSVFGHYLDHIGVCISYIALFIGLGFYAEKNFNLGLNYAYVSALCVFLIMTIRFYLERLKGGEAIHQNNILGFEHEDIIYIVIPITFINKIPEFLFFSYIGTPIFLIVTLLISFYKIKKL